MFFIFLILILSFLINIKFGYCANTLPLDISKNINITKPKYSALVLDAKTGSVLYKHSAKEFRYPASLTKLMTLYILFENLSLNKIKINQKFPVSKFASIQPATRLMLNYGERISVEEIILGLIIRSANDAAVVAAEGIAGSVAKFADLMNKKAKELGMKSTFFVNSTGLHDVRQKTNAYDISRLTLALIYHYSEYYSYFSRINFKYKNQKIESHNAITTTYRGAEGMKTGYVDASGYNLVSVAKRGKNRIIGVVLGLDSREECASLMRKLFDLAFANYQKDDFSNYQINSELIAIKTQNEYSKKRLQKQLSSNRNASINPKKLKPTMVSFK